MKKDYAKVYEEVLIVEKRGGEKLVIKNHENGEILGIDFDKEKDKFLNPEKYGKKV